MKLRRGSLTLLFETHATSVDNEAGVASGWADPPLSVLGEQQARDMAARRAGDHIVRAYTSDLIRAVRTAEIALAGRDIAIVRDRRLRECDYGTLTQAPAAEVEALRVTSVTKRFPSGESYADVVGRVEGWVDEILSGESTAGTVLVIGHRATFYALEHLLRGVPLADVVGSLWRWRPGWTYDIRTRRAGVK